MKKILLYKLLNINSRQLSYQQKAKWKKRLKWMAVFLFISTVSLGGLAIWGTVKLVNHAIASAPVLETLVPTEQNLAQGKQKLAELSSRPLISKQCLNQALSLLSPMVWLTEPIANNVKSFTNACTSKPVSRMDEKTVST